MNDGFGPGMIIGMLMGAFFSFMVTMACFTDGAGTSYQQFHSICQYEGGAVHDDVCIKDGRLLDIEIEGYNP